MSSMNGEIPLPKVRASPLDYPNTDLVSRLLAATPPYLYNIPLVPHSFFFSEMLRSLVQAKKEVCSKASPQYRRSRKRVWSQSDYASETSKLQMQHMTTLNWMNKNSEKPYPFDRSLDKPLELTTGKPSTDTKVLHGTELKSPSSSYPLPNFDMDNQEVQNFNMNSSYSSSVVSSNQNNHHPPDLALPPPPPFWYPPIYPPPYGIDPLHFFIDLRVSGQIYDRKVKDNITETQSSVNDTKTSVNVEPQQDRHRGNETPVFPNFMRDKLKLSGHKSAFTVPKTLSKNGPATAYKDHNEEVKLQEIGSTGNMKFDDGPLTARNKISTNYVMNNVNKIYRNLRTMKDNPEDRTDDSSDSKAREEEEIEKKRVKDLRALIGLELVVDYMNHAKPGQEHFIEPSERGKANSPVIEVAAVNEGINGEM